MAQQFAERIAAGLARKAVTRCSKWVERYRIMGGEHPGPYSHERYPWMVQIHDCMAEVEAVQKAAQMGVTEGAINKSFFWNDIFQLSVLYVLPSDNPHASNFSRSRFDPALEMSPHLKNLYTDVKNVGHKRAGGANLFIRGSRSKTGLKSDPISLIVFDEADEMMQENLALAEERTSGHKIRQHFWLSTPTVRGRGINAKFQESSQNFFFFKCYHCGHRQRFTFPESIVLIDCHETDPEIKKCHLICTHCKRELEHERKPEFLGKGEWVPTYTDRMTEGFHISQLYSMTEAPWKINQQYIQGISNAYKQIELHNSKLGLTFELEGSRVTIDQVRDAKKDYVSAARGTAGKFVTVGCDVGNVTYYEVTEWSFPILSPTNDINDMAVPRVLALGKLDHIEDIINVVNDFKALFMVIDARPEWHTSRKICNALNGRGKMCFYTDTTGVFLAEKQDETMALNADRTYWLDVALGRFKKHQISLPKDAPLEYADHITALVRHPEMDSRGQIIYRYVKGDKDADHYAHCRVYSEIALAQCATMMGASNISESV